MSPFYDALHSEKNGEGLRLPSLNKALRRLLGLEPYLPDDVLSIKETRWSMRRPPKYEPVRSFPHRLVFYAPTYGAMQTF